MKSVRLIGPGRAGLSLAAGAGRRAGTTVARRARPPRRPRGAPPGGVDVLVIATPDDAVAAVAAAVRPIPRCASSCTWPPRSASTSSGPMPGGRRCTRSCRCPPRRSAPRRLRRGQRSRWPATRWPRRWRGRSAAGPSRSPTPTAPPTTRPPASPPTTWWRCSARSSASPRRPGSGSTRSWTCRAPRIDDVARLGPAAALTGPAARGDWATLERHTRALPEEERPGYHAGVALANRLVGKPGPARRAGSDEIEGPEADQPADRVRAGV